METLAEGAAIRARFRLHLRCDNCIKESIRTLDVPEADDAPCDIDELLDSAFLQSQRFSCDACETPIALIAGIRQIRLRELEDV